MPRTLFSKIFLWSVLTQLATVGIIMVLVTSYLPESEAAVNNAFTLYADTAVALYERFGPETLDKFLARTGESTLLQLRFAATNSGADCHPSSSEQTGEATSSISAKGANGTYCLSIHAKSGELPDSPESRNERLQLVIILELLSCAGLSYFIARYLSRPMADLRRAATRLAKGDLAARVGNKFAGRHDEAAELIREFDQMAARVADLIEAQQRLIGDVSHEIKSPLARLNMALGLARRDAEQYAPKQFERIQREIDSISVLVQELLVLASMDTAAVRQLDDRIDGVALVSDVVADVGFENPDRVDDIVYTKPDHEICVLGDRSLLGRAIENVLRNAVFYTLPGARIEVRWEPSIPGRSSLVIVDNGPGVPEQSLPHLFDPFYRVDDARTRQTGGTGIGLAICRRAIDLHHGTVSARNVSPHGLAIVIDLPHVSFLSG